MSFNALGSVPVSLDIFSSWVTEMDATDLPPGASPDNQDVGFTPGSVFSRPALQKYQQNPISFENTLVYGKSFTLPNGRTKNIFVDSTGQFLVQDLTTGAWANLFLAATAPQESYVRSITANGREYLAISDLRHGSDVPLQWDGVNLDRYTQEGPGASPVAVNLILPASLLASLSRDGNNAVTAVTATDHGLLVGYQAQITGELPTAIGGGIASIVVDNDSLPGLATVTTNTPHGLVPNVQVILEGIASVAAGGGIVSAVRNGGVSTIKTSVPHKLQAGAFVTIAGVTDVTFNGNPIVATIVDANIFTYPDVDVNATSSGGTVSINWPIPSGTPEPTYFGVQTCPTPTTFTVQLSYSNATWTTGNVLFPWDGIFYVTEIVSPTSFVYQQYGPPAADLAATGMVTPYGQATPGLKQYQCSFQLRSGYITRPSPPVKFIANGGQYVSLSNIPIGPPNTVARIIEFTGTLGSQFFYIPVAGNVQGLIVSTSTVVDDNTTTTAVFDFSDNTLYAALGTSIPGNNLAAQVVIDGALNFAFDESRIITWGQRKTVQNLLNMTFDGGWLNTAVTIPLGWDVSENVGGALSFPIVSRGAYNNYGWTVSTAGTGTFGKLMQPAYQDGYNSPILKSDTKYTFRAYVQTPANVGNLVALNATLYSVSTGFSTFAKVVLSPSYNGYVQADFLSSLPVGVPTDLILSIYLLITDNPAGSLFNIFIDEMSLIYTDTPFLDTTAYASYFVNGEGLDGLTGVFGSASDTNQIMAMSEIRNTLYFLTLGDNGKLHEILGVDNGEPSTWDIKEVASNCGILGPLALTVSQADEGSSSGGEEWMMWMGNTGARIFGGGETHKISQEIQPNIDKINYTKSVSGFAQLTTWALNDPVGRIVYFGVPFVNATAPNLIIPVSYRELDSAESIAGSPPFHPSLAGRLIATDNTRKWTRWNMTMNGAALMYSYPQTAKLVPTFFGGNGTYPGLAQGFGNAYTLNDDKYTDDDFGLIEPYYITYMFPSGDQEQGLQLGAAQKIMAYLSAFISGLGNLTITLYVDSLDNPWPLQGLRVLQALPKHDLEWPAGSCVGQRIAVKIASSPLPGTTDNWFALSKLTAFMRAAKHLPVRGAI